MHKIADKEFTLDDFSHEHLYASYDMDGIYYSSTAEEEFTSTHVLKVIIEALNNYRTSYLVNKDKEDWWQMIQLLPSSYNQKRTVMLNYEVLANIYKSRKNHKLDEWHVFCDWIESLPYSELITGPSNTVKEQNTIDAVKVVRCKDCKHLKFSDCYGECSKGHMGIVSPDDFCSYGERK